jgi:hypothetical protein
VTDNGQNSLNRSITAMHNQNIYPKSGKIAKGVMYFFNCLGMLSYDLRVFVKEGGQRFGSSTVSTAQWISKESDARYGVC